MGKNQSDQRQSLKIMSCFCFDPVLRFGGTNQKQIYAKEYYSENGISQFTVVLFHSGWDETGEVTEVAIALCFKSPQN